MYNRQKIMCNRTPLQSQQILVHQQQQYDHKAAGFWIRFWAYTVDIVSFSFHWYVIDQTNISFVFIRHK